MTDFLMPSLGADMEAGTLVEWRIKPGDAVKRGDVVAVVETQKGAIEIEIFQDGTVEKILVDIGQRVPVGTALARIAGAGEVPAKKPPTPLYVPTPAPVLPPQPPRTPAEPAPAARRRMTPAARRKAEELGIDPSSLSGGGVEGAISLADVMAAASAALVPKAPATAIPAPERAARGGLDSQAMRRAIAAAMGRSKREIPHYYLSQTVDLARALAWMEQANAARPPTTRLLPGALLLRAVARALAGHPQLNGFWSEGGFQPGSGIHIGWAVALRGGGLIAPAIRDADRQTLDDLMARLRDLVQRARSGGLRSSELSDPTVTVTSLGERGAETVFPIIYPPQVAIIGIGRVVRRPWVVGDTVGIRPVVSLSLAGDHRASDGHMGGLLLAEIDRLLQEPETL